MPIQIRGRFKRDNVLFRYEPSYLKDHRDLQTDFLQDIDTNWQLVNGWRPPRDFDKSEINLDGSNILITQGSRDEKVVIISDRIFSEKSPIRKSRISTGACLSDRSPGL